MLDREQQYVQKWAKQLDIETQLKYHARATNTCQEKALLLSQTPPQEEWRAERVIKALYVERRGHGVGVSTPEWGYDVPIADILASQLHISMREAREYGRKKQPPQGMEYGTCTPFLFESSVEYEVHELIVVDHPTIDKKLCDISIGGCGEEAHKISMHLPYGGIYEILRAQFGERVHKVSIQNVSLEKQTTTGHTGQMRIEFI